MPYPNVAPKAWTYATTSMSASSRTPPTTRGTRSWRRPFPGTTPEQPFLSISQVVDAAEVEEKQVKESDGAGGIVEVTRKFPVWLRPRAGWGTPMCAALTAASTALSDWTAQHQDSYPPMLINITDGEAGDGDPVAWSQHIMELETNDGNVLVYNVHLSEMSAAPVQYPSDESEVTIDEYARQMFRMSSVFPDSVVEMASSMGLPVTQGLSGICLQRRRGVPRTVPRHRHPRRFGPAITCAFNLPGRSGCPRRVTGQRSMRTPRGWCTRSTWACPGVVQQEYPSPMGPASLPLPESGRTSSRMPLSTVRPTYPA